MTTQQPYPAPEWGRSATTAEIRAIKAMMRDGLSYRLIAQRLNRSLSSTKGIIYRNKLHLDPEARRPPGGRSPFKNSRQRTRVLEFFRRRLEEGHSGRAIAAEIASRFSVRISPAGTPGLWARQLGEPYPTLLRENGRRASNNHLRAQNKRARKHKKETPYD